VKRAVSVPVTALAAFAFVACSEPARAPRLPVDIIDGSVFEVGPFRRDGSSDATVDDAAVDSSTNLDAGLASCTVRDTSTVVAAAASSTFEPRLAVSGDEALAAWVETRATLPDIFVRRILASTSLGTELRLTTDSNVESSLSVVRNDDGYLLAYSRESVLSTDVATTAFDPVGLSIGGANDITLDEIVDTRPFLVPAVDSFQLYFERDATTSDVVRTTVSTNGSPLAAFADSSTSRAFVAPFVVDGNANDPRLFYVASGVSIESFRLGADGLAASPDDMTKTLSVGAYTLGAHIHVTPTNTSPRALLAEAKSGGRDTAIIARLASDGSSSGTPIELDTRTITASAMTTHGGFIVVAYRTTDSLGPAIRLRAYAASGALVLDEHLASIDAPVGSIDLVELSSGTLVVLEDENVGATRELRALRVDCPF